MLDENPKKPHTSQKIMKKREIIGKTSKKLTNISQLMLYKL
jgi:hypothetical protein